MSFNKSHSYASTSTTAHFTRREHFSRTSGKGGWYCNICTLSENPHHQSMTRAAARKHEQSSAHAAKLAQLSSCNWIPDGQEDYSGWLEPTPYGDLKTWEKQGFVDRQKDVIPFWRRGVDAAERGEEEEKWEAFLDRLEEKYNQNGGWDIGSDGWGRDDGANVWGPVQVPSQHDDGSWGGAKATWGWPDPTPMANRDAHRRRNSPAGKRKGLGKRRASDKDPWAFVEDVARQEAATAERKKQMHEFFNMPTQQKVQQIQSTIRFLHGIGSQVDVDWS